MEEKKLNWNPSGLDADLRLRLETLGEEYALTPGNDQCDLRFIRKSDSADLRVARERDGFLIEYGSLNAAARGAGLALAGQEAVERVGFDMFGIMLDCSRNAVMTVTCLKKWLRRLALMGYNMVMLYTEDTYKLEGESYFGYMRGAYSLDEIREIDEYAARLGIEVIPCIQTLGHLEQILRWSAYDKVRDTSSVLMVDSADTAALIGKMLDFWSRAVKSRRIHIGMDETHDLGRGRFMDRFGYERGFDLFNRHLGAVTEMCAARGLKPMIWSDMYFRMGNDTGEYYRADTVIPEDVKAKIPADVELVYWDYYHDNKEFYLDWINRHRELGHEPLMGSGVWTWMKLWYDHAITRANAKPCIDACRESGVRELFFTMWGDDGAYCDFDSSLAGLAWAAQYAFAGNEDSEKLEACFQAICGGGYAAHLAASAIENVPGLPGFRAGNVLWDDMLMGKLCNELDKKGVDKLAMVVEKFAVLSTELDGIATDGTAGDMPFVRLLTRLMRDKLQVRQELTAAYASRNCEELGRIADTALPALRGLYHDFAQAFRRQWLRKNKPQGLDVIQIRLGGVVARIDECILRVKELLDGKIQVIEELERPGLEGDVAEFGTYSKFAASSVARW